MAPLSRMRPIGPTGQRPSSLTRQPDRSTYPGSGASIRGVDEGGAADGDDVTRLQVVFHHFVAVDLGARSPIRRLKNKPEAEDPGAWHVLAFSYEQSQRWLASSLGLLCR